jgi:hypothetical protein
MRGSGATGAAGFGAEISIRRRRRGRPVRTLPGLCQRIREEHLDSVALVRAVAASVGVEVAAHFERIELRVGDVD